MNPVTSNGAVTGIEGYAPIDTDIAAAAVAAASAHRSRTSTVNHRARAVIRCIILVIIRSLSSRIRAHRQRHVAAAASRVGRNENQFRLLRNERMTAATTSIWRSVRPKRFSALPDRAA